MTDIWSFLLQTMTASGVAVLLLAVKSMFRDKLSPRWQFAVWGVLAVVLLLPAGRGGRYVLLNWPMLVEALKSAATGDFGTLTHVTAPIPLPPLSAPKMMAEWLYLIYAAGVVVLLVRHLVAYLQLRWALKQGQPARSERVKEVGERYGLSVCPVVEVDGLSTAFICGLFRPVLVLPAGAETDGKVILHELLHLKYRDVAWGWVICLFRCVHWCNPLLWLCADWAGNDLESLCDQRVLERLEGEERRDYGRILLSMADEKYARTPGTSSAANGGRNIRRRIEAIARFKRYPAGMALVSVCVILVLAAPLVTGARADAEWFGLNPTTLFASARTNYCTTYAGAFDAYAKAVLMGNTFYRAMCAPLEQQNELVKVYTHQDGYDDSWEYFGLGSARVEFIYGYDIYNLNQVGDDAWEGVLVIQLVKPPAGMVEWDGMTAHRWLAVQRLRAEKEGERWIVLPQEDIWTVQGDAREGGNLAVPAWVYEGEYGDFTLRIQWQTMVSASSNNIPNSNAFFGFSSHSFDSTPNPHAEFDLVSRNYIMYAIYHGDPDKKSGYTSIGVSCIPIYSESQEWSELEPLDENRLGNYSTSSSNGSCSGTNVLENGWDDWIFLTGGGDSLAGSDLEIYGLPRAYAVDLYLNGELAAELTLLPEGGEWHEPGE